MGERGDLGSSEPLEISVLPRAHERNGMNKNGGALQSYEPLPCAGLTAASEGDLRVGEPLLYAVSLAPKGTQCNVVTP